MPGDLYKINAAYRAKLLAGDAALRQQLVTTYRKVHAALQAELTAALADIGADPASVVYRVNRLRALEEQITTALIEWGGESAGQIAKSQRTAVELSQQAQQALLTSALAPAPAGIAIDSIFTAVPTHALEALVGFASDGSPLAALFAEIAPQAAEGARDAILAGLALGHGPDVVAAAMTDELGVPLTRSLRIARTETMRAYREGSRAYLQANDEFIKGWYWVAAHDFRTCPICWAMDGTFHTLDEPFGTHTNCRCCTVPGAKSWADMGFEGAPDRTWRPKETGEEAFAKLSASEQKAVLGKGKYELYKAGDLKLPDLVEKGTDERWGPYRTEKPLWMLK